MNDMVLDFLLHVFNTTSPSQPLVPVSTPQVNTLMVLWPQSLEQASGLNVFPAFFSETSEFPADGPSLIMLFLPSVRTDSSLEEQHLHVAPLCSVALSAASSITQPAC